MAAPYFCAACNHIMNDLRRDERPHRIMHQNNILRRRGNRRHRMSHRLLPVLAAFHELNFLLRNVLGFFFQTCAEALDFIRSQRNANLCHFRAGRKLAQGVNQNRRTREFRELFGSGRLLALDARSRSHTRAQARSRNNDDDLHRGCKYTRVEGRVSNHRPDFPRDLCHHLCALRG